MLEAFGATAPGGSIGRGGAAYNHDFLPNAMPRSALSAALFERQTRPSSRKRVKERQRLNM